MIQNTTHGWTIKPELLRHCNAAVSGSKPGLEMQRTERSVKEMLENLVEEKKQKEIQRIMEIVNQVDLAGLLVLSRDAETILVRKQMAEEMDKKAG